jgi:N-acetylglucosamine kinase-like BadF-type ATPase
MKIIAECGATKSDWRLIKDGEEIRQVISSGINVSTMKMSAIYETIAGLSEQFKAESDEVTDLHIYVAGVITDEIESDLRSRFTAHFPNAETEIQNDLLAAARALCGHAPGIATILGTGSNSCQYDGTEIVKRVYSSGFILGDEGSAATLGKLFVADFLKGLVPEEIAKDFSSRYQTDYSTIVANVYRSEGSPSGYLGGFAPFIMEYYGHPYIKELVDGNINSNNECVNVE